MLSQMLTMAMAVLGLITMIMSESHRLSSSVSQHTNSPMIGSVTPRHRMQSSILHLLLLSSTHVGLVLFLQCSTFATDRLFGVCGSAALLYCLVSFGQDVEFYLGERKTGLLCRSVRLAGHWGNKVLGSSESNLKRYKHPFPNFARKGVTRAGARAARATLLGTY